MNEVTASYQEEIRQLLEENKQLRSSLRSMIAWTTGGTCSDCTPFRRSPADIEWHHHKDCGHLEVINEACKLTGDTIEVGHNYDNPEAEMTRLAEERTAWCRANGLIK